MASSFYFAPDNDLKSMALSLWGPAPLLSTWYKPAAWFYSAAASGLRQTVVSAAVSGMGFCGSSYDSSGAWMMQHAGSLVFLEHTTASATVWPAPSGATYTGVAALLSTAYVLDASGRISVASGAALVPVSPSPAFGSGPARGLLAGSGQTLWTMLAAQKNLGNFTLSSLASGASGALSTPLDGLTCFAVSGDAAVGGWFNVAFGSGYNGLAVDPVTQLALAGSRTSAGAIDLYTSDGMSAWTLTQTVSGLGAPVALAWVPSDGFLFACDATNGFLRVLTYISGTLAFSQSIPIAGCAAASIASDSLNGLAVGTNALVPLTFSGTWASGTPIALTGAASVLASGTANALAGFASGIASYQLSAGTWVQTGSAALPFVPSALAFGDYGQVYAAGNAAGSGWVAALDASTLTVHGLGTLAGSADGLLYKQGQLFIPSSVQNAGYILGIVNLAPALENTFSVPPGAGAIAAAATDMFVGGTLIIWQYFMGAPYELRRARSGAVSVWHASGWNTLTLGVTGIPTAMTFDPSGNVSVISQQNVFYTINSSGALVSSGTIAQASGQQQAVTLGLSSLLWIGTALWAATGVNDAMVRVQ